MQRKLRKTSFMLALLLICSMLMPIATHAMSVIRFTVYSDLQMIGSVYTTDPDSVKVFGTMNNTVTEITYSGIYHNVTYDDNNTPYSLFLINGKYLPAAPTQLTVEVSGTTHTINPVPYSEQYPTTYIYKVPSTLVLDVYRMTGQFLAPTVTGATYLPAGSNLISFTPKNIDSSNGFAIHLPYNSTASAKINADEIDFIVPDFEIFDQTVSSAVYYNSFSYTGSTLEFKVTTPLEKDHEYVVKLSSTSSGNEILLPADGTYTASVSVGDIDGFNYKKENIVYFRNMTIGPKLNNPSDTPSIPEDPAESPDVDTETVNEESLRGDDDKEKVAITIANGKKQVLLPAKAAEMVGDRKLELSNDEIKLEVPPGLLKKLQGLVSDEQLADAQISLNFEPVSEEDTGNLLDKAQEKAGNHSKVKTAGDVYEFKLSVVTSDGKETLLEQFDEPITLKLKFNAEANQALLGVYYIGDDGELEYVGGKIADGEIAADVHHFSKYAVLEYDKTYNDVSDQFWAHNVIKELSAKHIISGVSDSEFAPQNQMTRAEFAALITRTLGLQATKAAAFNDVPSNLVHADAIAAANEAGIILGRSAEQFAPNDQIKREEMAIMIVRAYEYATGEKITDSPEVDYQDRSKAADWALSYIDAASSIGFIQGRGNGAFAPKAMMTRAEGAQVIYKLFKGI